jgi:hypothetical protein
MTNHGLGKALDRAHLVRCPYGESWGAVLSSNAKTKSNAATALVAKIRKWVNKPGISGRAGATVDNASRSA